MSTGSISLGEAERLIAHMTVMKMSFKETSQDGQQI